VRAYLALLSARFQVLLQYRAAAAAGMTTQLFWGLIRVMIFEAFYRSAPPGTLEPMRLDQVVTYVWLGQAMIALMPWNVEPDLKALIRTGNVAYELLRPLDLYGLWYVRSVAYRVAPALLRSVPISALALLFLGMQPPSSWAAFAGWVATTLGAILLSGAISTLLAVTLFWTLSADGITRMAASVVVVFSGLIIPLPLFPDWAQAVLNVLPFRGLMDVPFRVYMGHIPPRMVLFELGLQLLWTAAIVAIGRWILARGTRRLVVQGG
jgi:ABC-2 type transport system permease protein